MTETFEARIVVEGDASKAISELNKLKSSMGGIAKGGAEAGKGIGQLDGNMQKLLRGDPKSALMGVVGSLGPIGAAAIAAAGGVGMLWHEFDKATEAVKQQIDSVDKLADRYSLTMHAANELLNVSKIFGVEVNSLGRVFKTLASKGIAPSVDGLLQVKKQLDLISDPTKRTNEAFRLLGRGALLLADFLASDNKQLEIWVARAKSLQSVTKRMTDDQDEFNRTMGYYKAVAENANVTIFGTTLGLKQQLQQWWASQSAIGANTIALQKFGVYGNAAGMNIDKTTQLLKIFQENQEAGIKLTLDEANSLLVSTQFREAYNKHLGRTAPLANAAGDAVEQLTEDQYLQAAAEALMAGDTAGSAKFLELARSAKAYNTKLEDTLRLLKLLTDKKWWVTLGVGEDIRSQGLPKVPKEQCFVAGTLVNTPDGPKPIETLEIGDSVWISAPVAARVAGTMRAVRDDLVELRTDTATIRCSPNHRFAVPTGWREASDLREGDVLLAGQTVRDMKPFPGEFEVFNLEIDHPSHQYMVHGHVVHNKKAQHGGALGGITLVGEAGPELIVGNTVIPATLTKQLLALGVLPTAHHMMVSEGSQSGTYTPGVYETQMAGATKKKKTVATTSGGGSGGSGATMAAVSQETAAIVAAIPGAAQLAQAVTAPMQSQTAAIERSNANLTDRLDTMIALLQRAATNDGIGRAVRDSMNQRV